MNRRVQLRNIDRRTTTATDENVTPTSDAAEVPSVERRYTTSLVALATLLRVREEIAAMERCGAVGSVLEEARRHARELADILADASP